MCPWEEVSSEDSYVTILNQNPLTSSELLIKPSLILGSTSSPQAHSILKATFSVSLIISMTHNTEIWKIHKIFKKKMKIIHKPTMQIYPLTTNVLAGFLFSLLICGARYKNSRWMDGWIQPNFLFYKI